MIDEITLKNMDTLKSVTMSKEFGNPYVIETDGIQWGTVSATHNTVSNLTGVGHIVTSTSVKDRPISITGRICPVHTTKQIATLHNTSDIEEIEQYKLFEIEDACAALSKIINPFSVLRISIGDFYIEGMATASLSISHKWKENNEVYKKFTFSLECANPMFLLKNKRNVVLSGVSGGFHFPLRIPEAGMHFGEVQKYQLVLVENFSDIPTGVVIYMKATGTVENPTLTDVYSQKSIRIKKTLSANEIVKIDTVARKVYGSTDNGQTYEYYLDYWDWDNDWMEFPVGSSLLGFSADNETYKSLIVWIELQQSIYTLQGE